MFVKSGGTVLQGIDFNGCSENLDVVMSAYTEKAVSSPSFASLNAFQKEGAVSVIYAPKHGHGSFRIS
jgi:hypothetical protein